LIGRAYIGLFFQLTEAEEMVTSEEDLKVVLRCMDTTQSICCEGDRNIAPIPVGNVFWSHVDRELFDNLCEYSSPLKHVTLFTASVVGIATGYGLDEGEVGVQVPVGARIFSLLRRPDRFLRSSKPPIQWVMAVLPLGVKWPGRQADHLCRGQENMDLYIHSPMRLHGLMLH
jgi:hypothetical protein